MASAGLAILAHLPKEEVEQYLQRSDLTERWGPAHDRDELRVRIEQTRQRGYAASPGFIVAGSWGMDAAVFSRSG
ncbi:MAG: IclR family transcriptional regulator C-terminal domain-containing protein [Nakamurella sp.]